MKSQQPNETISFVFEQQDHQLVINAQTENVLYCAKLNSNQLISFDNIKKALEIKNFTMVEQNKEHMKLMIGGVIELDFASKQKIIVDELKQSIENLTLKLEAQIQKNQQLSLLITNQQVQIQTLNEKLSTQNEMIQSSLQQHKTQTDEKFQELSQEIAQLKLGQQEQQIKQDEDTRLNEKTHEQIQSLIERFKVQINQNLLKQESKHQKSAQELTNVTAKLTQLRTQFDQLLTQTIPKFLTSDHQFLHDSKVFCQEAEKSTLIKFFIKPIKQVRLLYRASDHGFCAKKFHEKCDGIADTLTVVWTEFDRKIGGFTPLKWSSHGGYAADNTNGSFIFSLTHNDKFTLQKPNYAIHNTPNYGSTFGGGHDLHVCDKANSANGSHTNICHSDSYHNEKYKQGDKASWERFHGGSTGSCNFKTKEWEVWAVEWA